MTQGRKPTEMPARKFRLAKACGRPRYGLGPSIVTEERGVLIVCSYEGSVNAGPLDRWEQTWWLLR